MSRQWYIPTSRGTWSIFRLAHGNVKEGMDRECNSGVEIISYQYLAKLLGFPGDALQISSWITNWVSNYLPKIFCTALERSKLAISDRKETMLKYFEDLKSDDMLKNYGNFSGLTEFSLALEFHWGGSATNGATPTSWI